MWTAEGIDEAIKLAEAEAAEYAEMMDGKFIGLTQAYQMYDDLRSGAEVFSLVRLADIEPSDYLDQFFDTGRERQRDFKSSAADQRSW